MSRTRISTESFLLAFVGAALLILGTMMSWVSVQLAGDLRDTVAPNWLGIDTSEGKAVAVIGVLSITGILVLGSGRLSSWLTAIVIGLGVGAVAALVITIVAAAGALDRFRTQGLEQAAAAVARLTGQPVDKILAQMKATAAGLASVKLGAGLWISMAGAVILGTAALVALRGSRSTEPSTEGAEPVRS